MQFGVSVFFKKSYKITGTIKIIIQNLIDSLVGVAAALMMAVLLIPDGMLPSNQGHPNALNSSILTEIIEWNLFF